MQLVHDLLVSLKAPSALAFGVAEQMFAHMFSSGPFPQRIQCRTEAKIFLQRNIVFTSP